MTAIDIGRMKPGFRVSIKGPSQAGFGITPEDIDAMRYPRIAHAGYNPTTREWQFRVGCKGVEGLSVTNSAGHIEFGNDMRVTFPAKGSFRFTDGLVSMASYDAYQIDGTLWGVILPEGLVIEQSDNVLARAGL